MDIITLNANALRIKIFLQWKEGERFPDLSGIPFKDSTFHLEYEAILPAVEKIVKLGFHVLIVDGIITITGMARNSRQGRQCRIISGSVAGDFGPFVYLLYKAVVQFVTWYQQPHEHLITLN